MKNTKILLTTNILRKDYGEPVGILFLAAYLRREGFYVDIFDPQIEGDENLCHLKSQCEKEKYQFVGISVLTSADESLEIVKRMSRVIKEMLPETVIGCGGVGASLRYREFVNIEGVDLVMLGEGERTITDVANMVEKNADCFVSIPGVVTQQNDKFIKRDLIKNLDDIPFMARDTLDERIKSLNSEMIKKFEVRIFCGRGCFGTCTFCANYSVATLCNGYRCRQRSVESLVKEMEELHKKYGVVRFSFWDDNFLPVGEDGLKKVQQILELFKKLSFKPIFGIQTRVDTLTREIVEILQQAGMQNIYLGIENINRDELKILGKQVSPEQIRNALRILYEFGYSYNSESIYRLRIGYIAFTPYSTISSIRENYEFIEEFGIPINKLNKKLLAFHDTSIRKMIERDGLLTDNFSWKFSKPGVEQLYNAIVDITRSYSKIYDKVRFVSKVCKFNGMDLDWDFVKLIKEKLMLKTSEGVKKACYYAEDDFKVVRGMDQLVDDARMSINEIDNEYGIFQKYDEFCKKHQSEINNFNKAAYVFFD